MVDQVYGEPLTAFLIVREGYGRGIMTQKKVWSDAKKLRAAGFEPARFPIADQLNVYGCSNLNTTP